METVKHSYCEHCMSSRAEVLTLDPTAELITDNINVEDRHFQVKLNIFEAIKGKKSEHGSDSAGKYIIHKHAAFLPCLKQPRHLCVCGVCSQILLPQC